MHVNYRYVEYIIFLEFFFVALVLVATYGVSFWYFLKNKRKRKLSAEIEHYLKTNQTFLQTPKESFPRKWLKIDILVPLVLKLDQSNSKHWHSIREKFLDEVLLPLARKCAYRYNWLSRYLAVRALEFKIDKNDENVILKLMADKIALVKINAIYLGLKLGSQNIINFVIDEIGAERRMTQSIYLKAFDEPLPESQAYVAARLKKESDPYLRATCYKILLNYSSPLDLDKEIQKDLKSKNVELKLAAIRYMVYAENSKAVAELIDLLKDSQWEIRVLALQSLGELKAEKAIDQVAALLKDQEWWVRMNAAKALLKMGNAGKKILTSQDPQTDQFAYDAAQNVLRIS